MGRKLTYKQILDLVEQKGCQLVTNETDFTNANMGSKSYYDIIGACKHPSRIKYDMFKAKSCGVLCKACATDSASSKNKTDVKTYYDIEISGYCYLREMLLPFFTVQKMVEGTKADFAIKPHSVTDDKWLGIQLKTSNESKSQNSHNLSFSIRTEYPKMLVCFTCLSPECVIAIPGDNILGIKKLAVGNKHSKYNKYKVDDFKSTFTEHYNTIELKSFQALNTPIGIYQQREQEYRGIREQYMPYIDFKYPEREGLAYDFIVNGFKVQEKVAGYRRKRKKLIKDVYSVNLAHGYPAVPYKVGENDFYWFNIPDSTLFFLIPEKVMQAHGKLRTDTDEGRSQMSFNTSTDQHDTSINSWSSNYKFDYTTVSPQCILDMFNSSQVKATN